MKFIYYFFSNSTNLIYNAVCIIINTDKAMQSTSFFTNPSLGFIYTSCSLKLVSLYALSHIECVLVKGNRQLTD